MIVWKKLKKHGKSIECSILTNVWNDRKYRSVMNLCVHCKGTSFIKFIEDD